MTSHTAGLDRLRIELLQDEAAKLTEQYVAARVRAGVIERVARSKLKRRLLDISRTRSNKLALDQLTELLAEMHDAIGDGDHGQ